MLEFKKLELNNIPLVAEYFSLNPSMISGRSIGGLFMWRDHCTIEYCEINNVLYLKGKFGSKIAFFPPYVKNVDDFSLALLTVKKYCDINKIDCVFCNVDEGEIENYKCAFSNIEVSFNETWSDYVYNSTDLMIFSGKKYHGQRNFVNRFKKLYPNYKCVEVTLANLDTVKEFVNEYYEIKSKNSAMFYEEKQSVFEVFDNFELYNLFGLAITVDDKIIAVSFGEKAGETIFIHIEKANTGYSGAYQMIVSEFAKRYALGVKYINREDDAGDEGLRQSKKSYHPVFMLKKYNVKIIK